MTETYATAQYCLNGHLIAGNTLQKAMLRDFCPKCGKKTITQCPKCNAPVQGDVILEKDNYYLNKPQRVAFSQPRNGYCHSCGAAYPWTEQKLTAVNDTLLELEDLNPEEVERVRELIPDIIIESPKTDLAIVRIQKLFNQASPFVKQMLNRLLIDFACTAIKSFFNLP